MVLLPGVALGPLLDVLQHPPEHGPFQEDVLALKVLRRQPDVLDLFIRIRRSRIVTVSPCFGSGLDTYSAEPS